MKETIRTERLEIMPYRRSDMGELAGLMTCEELKDGYMLPGFADGAAAEAMCEKLYGYSHSQEHFERGIYLDGKLIGFVNDVEISGGEIELGYLIHPGYQNRGYASEMLEAVIKELFAGGFDRAVCCVFDDNAASVRVLLKCGLKKTEKKCDIDYRGRVRPCSFYSAERESIAPAPRDG